MLKGGSSSLEVDNFHFSMELRNLLMQRKVKNIHSSSLKHSRVGAKARTQRQGWRYCGRIRDANDVGMQCWIVLHETIKSNQITTISRGNWIGKSQRSTDPRIGDEKQEHDAHACSHSQDRSPTSLQLTIQTHRDGPFCQVPHTFWGSLKQKLTGLPRSAKIVLLPWWRILMSTWAHTYTNSHFVHETYNE